MTSRRSAPQPGRRPGQGADPGPDELARRLAAHTTDFAILTLDGEGVVCTWNAGAERVFQYRAEEIVGRPGAVLFTEEDRAAGRPEDEMGRAAETGHAEDTRWHRRRDGSRVWVTGTMTALRDEAGTLLGFGKIVRDATALRAAAEERERLLAESEATSTRVEQILESISDAFYAVDAEFRFTYVNRRAEAWWGRCRKELLGRHLWTEFPQAVDGEPYRRHQEVMATREPTHFEVRSPVLDRWIDVHIYPEASGGLACYFHDITERHAQEAALRAGEARLAAIVEHLAVGLVVANAAGEVVHWNPAALAMHGYATLAEARAPLAALPALYELRTLDDDRRLRLDEWPMSRLLRGETVRHEEYRVRRLDQGWERILDYTGALIRTASGEELAYLSTADLTTWRAAEAAVRRSESRYRSLFESIDEGFCIVEMLYDAEGRPVDYRFLEINPTFERQTGMRDVQGHTIRELVPDIEAHWIEIYGEVARTGEPSRFTNQAPSMGRWFDVYAFRVGEPEARQVALLFRDITERRRGEEALRESRAQLARIFELSPSFLAVLRGPELVFELANPSYQQLIGHRDVIGHPVGAALPEIAEQGFLAILEAVYRTGEPFVGREAAVQLQRTPQAPLEQRYVNFVFQPLRESAGAVDGILITGVDVTELVLARHTIERALGDARAFAAQRDADRQRLLAVLEQTPLAIAILDPSGGVTFRNPAFADVWGHAAGDVSAERYSEAYRAYHLDGRVVASHEWPAARALRGEPVENEILETVPPAGRPRRVWINAAPVRDAEGRITGAVVITRDVTTEHTLEQQLRASQRLQAVGTLAGGVAHEINNSMTAVLGYGEFVLRGLGAGHPQAADMQVVLQAAERAAKISQQLLAFTRQQVTQHQVVELPALVGRLEPVLRQLLGADKTLVIPTPGPLPPISADTVQVEQVLINLVANARDALDHGGRVTIAMRECTVGSELPAAPGEPVAPGRYVRLAVTDTGHGMSAATLERIFDPFFTTKDIGRGTGLGLSMVYGTLRRHGGYVRPQSAPGLGTTMELYWPLMDGAADAGGGPGDQPGASAPGPVAEATTRSRAKVLVVEDEDMVRALAVRVLEDAGYEVMQAADGAVALSLVGEGLFRPDLVVTDVIMPGMTGRQLDDAIRSRWPGIPVLHMSGHTGEAAVLERLVPTGAAFLGKPFTPDALSRAVRELLATPR